MTEIDGFLGACLVESDWTRRANHALSRQTAKSFEKTLDLAKLSQ